MTPIFSVLMLLKRDTVCSKCGKLIRRGSFARSWILVDSNFAVVTCKNFSNYGGGCNG